MFYQYQFSTYTFAYYSVYGKNPKGSGNYAQLEQPPVSNELVQYKGLFIDPILKTDWIDELLKLCNDNISLTAVSPGYDRNYLTHIIFTINNIKQYEVEMIVSNINNDMLSRSSYFFNDYSAHICIASQNWYRDNPLQNKKWTNWWDNSYNLLKTSINKGFI